jgi:SAM-dependent methyltransferase
VADRIKAVNASMDALPIEPGSLDAIWSEGAIYNMGFQRGVSDWRKYLKKGGVLAVSEITWLTQTRPHELESHWNEAYPEIATASEKIKILEKADYRVLGYFVLPVTSWEENYYQPMEDRFEDFLNSQNRSVAAEKLVQNERAEIALFRKYNHYFGYGFYIAEKL